MMSSPLANVLTNANLSQKGGGLDCDSNFESVLLSPWFLTSEIVGPWPSRIKVPKEWVGDVAGLGDIDNGDLRAGFGGFR